MKNSTPKKDIFNLLSLILFFFFLFLFSKAEAQTTIWSDNFEGNAVGSQTSTGLNPTQWFRNLNGVNINGDWFEVRSGGGNEYFEAKDVDGTVYWFTQSIDISYYTNVSVSIDGSESGNCNTQDYLQFHYRLNGGAWTRFTTNWRMRGNFTSRVASVSGISGASLEIRVSFRNNRDSEFHRIDNVLIQGVRNTCTISPDEVWREDFETSSPKGNVTSAGGGTMARTTYPQDNSGGFGIVGTQVNSVGVWTSNSIDISSFFSDTFIESEFSDLYFLTSDNISFIISPKANKLISLLSSKSHVSKCID